MTKRINKKNNNNVTVGSVSNNRTQKWLLLNYIKTHRKLILLLFVCLFMLAVVLIAILLTTMNDSNVDYTDSLFTEKQIKMMNEQELEKIANSKVDTKKNPTIAAYKAEALIRTAKFNEAAIEYQKIINSGYGNYMIYIKKAESEYLAANYKSAVMSYEQAIKLITTDNKLSESYKEDMLKIINNKISIIKYYAGN